MAMSDGRQSIVIAGGGTGGHVFPALATAQELGRRGYRVVFATDPRGRALAALPEGVAIAEVRAPRMSGGAVAKLRGAFGGVYGVFQALALLRREKAALVMSFGGYTAVPVLAAAVLARVPFVLHELDAVLGRTNRLFQTRAARVTTAFPRLIDLALDQTRSVHTGTPVRPGFAPLAYAAPDAGATIHLLVIGGSQGARILSDCVPEAIALLPPAIRARLSIVQQVRGEDRARVEARYAELGLAAEIATFFADMPARLAKAHLLVARSGASTIAELTTTGRPALLIPYQFAMNDHQTKNASALAAAGAARVLSQKDCTPQTLAAALATLLEDPATLAAMAAAARAQGQPDAAARLAEVAASLVPAPEVRRDPFVKSPERRIAA
jgi:UDP-N-acetylglucosamine--N-acetylmuramyl-(pentapeptide) pyrophosphoryl-undecaprenol N-acetylglucosamine transferase